MTSTALRREPTKARRLPLTRQRRTSSLVLVLLLLTLALALSARGPMADVITSDATSAEGGAAMGQLEFHLVAASDVSDGVDADAVMGTSLSNHPQIENVGESMASNVRRLHREDRLCSYFF
ncbi:hypothetical protein DFJ73DRAFT_811415 [Zopfochytrium polystomum]|nr:hypothetical protein DFJ73DRAFT_811415 [Zopfochytrium polystomum]